MGDESGELRLGRFGVNLVFLRWIAILLPLSFLVVVEVLRHVVFQSLLGGLLGFLVEHSILAAGIAVFSFTIFGVIERQQSRITEQTRRLSVLNEIGRAAAEKLRLEDLLGTSLDLILETMDADAGLVCLVDIEHAEHSAACARGFSEEFVGKGVRLDFFSDGAVASQVVGGANRLETAKALPADTLFMLSTTGLDKAWAEFRNNLEDMDESAISDMEGAFDMVSLLLGVDVERDIIRKLTGEITLALLHSEFRIGLLGDPQGAIKALLLAETGADSDLQRPLELLMGFLEDTMGLSAQREDVGDYEAVTLDLADLTGVDLDLSPGYMFTTDFLAIGTTIGSFSDMVDALDGPGQPLTSDPEFSRLVEMAPENSAVYMFADIAGIVDMVVDALPPSVRSDYESDVRPDLGPFSALFAASAVTEQASHATLVLTVQV
jgi:hypothetical protein